MSKGTRTIMLSLKVWVLRVIVFWGYEIKQMMKYESVLSKK